MHIAHIISQVQTYHGTYKTFLFEVLATSDCKSESRTIQSNCRIFKFYALIGSNGWCSCNQKLHELGKMQMCLFSAEIIPSNANNDGVWQGCHGNNKSSVKSLSPVFVLGTCVVSYALSTKLPPPPRQTPMSTCSSKTNKLARRWNSDVHMDRFGNCWHSCVACSEESSFLQDKKACGESAECHGAWIASE